MYIHRKRDENPVDRTSTNLHRQKNTLYLESLRYGIILHAKRILKTIEDGCMKCLRRKKKYLKQSIGQPLEASFKKISRPFQYIQMDLTGRHVTAGGEEVYGLVCVCLQTYNTRIYVIQYRKLESISLAIEVLIQEVGAPDFIACDREGAFQQLAKELCPKDIEALESKHQVQFRFAVPNAHFTTGLVERRMRMIHDFMGKLNMQATGMLVSDISLMFQYVACRINTIPYGVKNINTYSESKIQDLRQGSELITFISPADWMMFQAPKGIDFRSIQNTRGTAIQSTVEKLEALEEFRTNEMMKVLNKQYDNVCLESSNKLKINSVVLIRNIANETKREPLKIARVEEIKESRDDTQRVVVVTYHNVGMNKKGNWIGTPVTVERSVNDLVLVDDAFDESMLKPGLQNNELKEYDDQNNDLKENDDQDSENEDVTWNENQDIQEIVNDTDKNVNGNDEDEDKHEIEVRRSNRKRIQRINIQPDEIGDCDDENDQDYK